MTGEGMDELFDAVRAARDEYETDYKPELEKIIAERVRLLAPFSHLRCLSGPIRPNIVAVLIEAPYPGRNGKRKRKRPTRSRG